MVVDMTQGLQTSHNPLFLSVAVLTLPIIYPLSWPVTLPDIRAALKLIGGDQQQMRPLCLALDFLEATYVMCTMIISIDWSSDLIFWILHLFRSLMVPFIKTPACSCMWKKYAATGCSSSSPLISSAVSVSCGSSHLVITVPVNLFGTGVMVNANELILGTGCTVTAVHANVLLLEYPLFACGATRQVRKHCVWNFVNSLIIEVFAITPVRKASTPLDNSSRMTEPSDLWRSILNLLPCYFNPLDIILP